MERRTTANRARLTLERLDERIAPSHGQTDGPDESHGLALGHAKRDLDEEPRSKRDRDDESRSVNVVVTALMHDLLELVSTAAKVKDSSPSHTVGKQVDHETKSDKAESHGTNDAADSSGKTEPHTTPTHAAATTVEPVVHAEAPPKAVPAALDGAIVPTHAKAETVPEDVRVPGPLGVQILGDQIRFISTDAQRAVHPTIISVDAGGETADPATALEAEPVEADAQGNLAVKPDAVTAPPVQTAAAVARFVPFAPAALDGAVRRFLAGLKSPDRDGMSLTSKVIAWSAAIAGAIFISEIARRKKLPQKAVEYLSLSKLLTRTKTK